LENIAKGEVAEFWKNLVDTLSKIPGLNLNETAGDIEDIGEALSEYKTKELDKVPKVMEDIRQEFKETEGPIKNVDDALREAGKTSEDLAKASDEIEHLKQQVLDFFSISNAIDIFKRALSSAFDTVKELDAVMTEAAVVTDFSIGDMWEQMPQYSKNASELGVATKELYAATTLYY
jgi:methyl-accepting chemotaxis protein